MALLVLVLALLAAVIAPGFAHHTCDEHHHHGAAVASSIPCAPCELAAHALAVAPASIVGLVVSTPPPEEPLAVASAFAGGRDAIDLRTEPRGPPAFSSTTR